MAFIEDLRLAPPLKWGILGTGMIASAFVQAVKANTRQQVVSVGSRNATRVETFASKYAIPTTHASYEALVADKQVDVVYIASPHSEHLEHALLAIREGKHVLVEKAFTRNAAEAERLFAAAAEADVFVMEAMWTRFLPHMAQIRQIIGAGELGDIILVEADHGQYFPFDPEHRTFNPNLAGGALLDLGVYPVSFAHSVLGTPDSIVAVGTKTETGVDGQVSMILSYGQRTQAVLTTTLWSKTATKATITGTEGRIDIEGDFYAPTAFTFTSRTGGTSRYENPIVGGLQYEAAEVARCVHEGARESSLMTHAQTLEIMRTMDEVRRQVGVTYPGE